MLLLLLLTHRSKTNFLNKPTTPPPAHSFPPLTNAWKKYLHLIPRRLPERPHLDFYFFSPFVWEFVESGIGFRFSGVPSITSIEVRSIFTPISYFEAAWRKKSNIIGAGGGHFRILFYFSSSLSRLTLGGKLEIAIITPFFPLRHLPRRRTVGREESSSPNNLFFLPPPPAQQDSCTTVAAPPQQNRDVNEMTNDPLLSCQGKRLQKEEATGCLPRASLGAAPPFQIQRHTKF